MGDDTELFLGMPIAPETGKDRWKPYFLEHRVPERGVILLGRTGIIGAVLPLASDDLYLRRHVAVSIDGGIMGIEVRLRRQPGVKADGLSEAHGTPLDFGGLPLKLEFPTDAVAVGAVVDPGWVRRLALPGTVRTFGRRDVNATYDAFVTPDILVTWANTGLWVGKEMREEVDRLDSAQRSAWASATAPTVAAPRLTVAGSAPVQYAPAAARMPTAPGTATSAGGLAAG